ncbi:hypothetical protein NXS19_009956 [Fusarium pseudograminearum]|nr:hypothetical protein NXS19_009956 [Fusarium pseudograminearum]
MFSRWTSSYGTQELPSSSSQRRKEDSRLCVSVWSEDLPLSAAKRKRGDDDDDETPSPRRQGKMGAPAPGRGASQPLSQSTRRSLATSEFIEWEDSLGVESLKAKAMVQHDMHEQKRIRNFNTELIIRSARNYIVEVVKAGTPNPLHQGCHI